MNPRAMISAATRNGPAGERRGRTVFGTAAGLALGGLGLAAVLVLAGCSLIPGPGADPTRFYVLTTSASAPAPAAGQPALQLRPVEVAGYLRNPTMVIRRGEHEIEFRDLARWGEPLELGIARVLGEELRARGVAVATAARRDLTAPGRQLSVRVLACEGTGAGGVIFRAAWECSQAGDPAAAVAPSRGEFQAAGLSWDGKSEALLAARLSEAVAALAGEVARAVGSR